MARPEGRMCWLQAWGHPGWDGGQSAWKPKFFICAALVSPFGLCPSYPMSSTMSQHKWQPNKYKAMNLEQWTKKMGLERKAIPEASSSGRRNEVD